MRRICLHVAQRHDEHRHRAPAFAIHLPYAPIPDACLPLGITIFKRGIVAREEMKAQTMRAKWDLFHKKTPRKTRMGHAHKPSKPAWKAEKLGSFRKNAKKAAS